MLYCRGLLLSLLNIQDLSLSQVHSFTSPFVSFSLLIYSSFSHIFSCSQNVSCHLCLLLFLTFFFIVSHSSQLLLFSRSSLFSFLFFMIPSFFYFHSVVPGHTLPHRSSFSITFPPQPWRVGLVRRARSQDLTTCDKTVGSLPPLTGN